VLCVTRDPDKLRRQSLHVFWHLRQVLGLSAHLERRRREGHDILLDPVDAGALEAFAINARALVDFFWRTRERHSGAWAHDAIADDWMTANHWDPGEVPAELRNVRAQAGAGVAHISYRRLDGSREWSWKHLDVAHRLAYWFACFADDADQSLLAENFREQSIRAIIEWRQETEQPAIVFGGPPISVATPGDPSLLTQVM
jgi:hypothetical protein